MNKYKLVLIFDDDSEVNGIDKVLIFENHQEAISYLTGTGKITNLKIELDHNYFSFKNDFWSCSGKLYYALYL